MYSMINQSKKFLKKLRNRRQVPALNERHPPEIARVRFSTRTKLPGGFGGPGGGFVVEQ